MLHILAALIGIMMPLPLLCLWSFDFVARIYGQVSASVADVHARDIGFGVNLEHPPTNDFQLRRAGS